MTGSRESKTIVLTGGTGFLGYHLVRAFRDASYGVRVLRRPGSVHPLMKVWPEGVLAVDVDFADSAALERACRGASAVVHGAGLVSYNRKDQGAMRETHVELTRRMLAAARAAGVPRFVHVSSIVTLGQGPEPRDERAVYNASGLRLAYWDTKTEAEQLALAANAPGFEVVAVNPGSLLGEGEKNGQLLPFVKKMAESERPFLPDGGSDFLDVRDAAIGTLLALEKGRAGERYVLGCENLSYAQFHARLRGVFGKKSRPRLVPRWLLALGTRLLEIFEFITRLDLPVNSSRLRRVNGVYMYHDLAKARRELGYAPAPIDRALRVMLEK